MRDSIKKLLASFSGQANTLAIPRAYVGLTGDVETALLLSQLVYWSDKSHNGWVYKTYLDWENEIGLNEYKIRRSRKKLESMGILETKLKKANGSPTVHYRIDSENFTDSIIRYCKICSMESVKFKETMESANFKETTNRDYTEITTENTHTSDASDTSSEKDPESCAAASAEKELFTSVEEAFLSQLEDETQYSYPRERKHINKLIERVRNKASPADFLRQAIETFYRLHNGRDKFWKKQPFLPSVLNSSGIWPRVLEEAKTDYVDTGVELWN